MFITAYDTTPCRDYVTDKIVAAIAKQASLRPEIFLPVKSARLNRYLSGIYQIKPEEVDIPPFGHPIQAKYRDESAIFIDVRNCTRMSREGDMVVASQLDYTTMVMRAITQKQWITHSPKDFLGMGSYPVTIYTRWLSEAITKRLALTPDIQMRVVVICAYFYIRSFYENADGLNDGEKIKHAQLISRATYVGIDDILSIIEPLDHPDSINWLINTLKTQAGSTRFETFNLGLLYSLFGNAWFGNNYREIVAVALEHPPTFLTLLAQATDERGYHNTNLGKLAKQYDTKDSAKTFLHNFQNMPID